MLVDLDDKLYNLTTPRRNALHVFAHHHPRPVQRSDGTGLQAGQVHWQTLDWLESEGFAAVMIGTGGTRYGLTRFGRRLARKARLM